LAARKIREETEPVVVAAADVSAATTSLAIVVSEVAANEELVFCDETLAEGLVAQAEKAKTVAETETPTSNLFALIKRPLAK
jgi:quinolinate synthase